MNNTPPPWVADKESKLEGDHMGALKGYVENLRSSSCVRQVPHFDPDDGGVRARVLLLKEAPGPTAIKSGFVTPRNAGQTAMNMTRVREESGMKPCMLANWNVVPWYVGNADGSKIRPPTKAEVAEGVDCAIELLKLLPDIRVIILTGNKARKGWDRSIGRDFNHPTMGHKIEVLSTWHPSPVCLNMDPGRYREMVATFKKAVEIAGDNPR